MHPILYRHRSPAEGRVGRIVTSVTVGNIIEAGRAIRCDALVDTGAYCLTLPAAWKTRLGLLPMSRVVEAELADHRIVPGEVCGPVRIQIDGFDAIAGEVLFLDMEAENGRYEPLIGYITLEQARLVVDLVGHRLVRLPHVDLKRQRVA